RPLLDRYAHRTRIDPLDRADCIEAVMEEVAMRWAIDGAAPPKNMLAYLLRAINFRRKSMEREAKRRAKRYELAGRATSVEGAVLSLCSEAAVRDSYGPAETLPEESHAALGRFFARLVEPLSEEERGILARLGDGVPHREIAAELGASYEAARKRIQRLCARVRDLVPEALERLSQADRALVQRLLSRMRPQRSRGAD